MTVPGHLLPTAAPIGTFPRTPASRFAKTTRGAGAAAGNQRCAPMTPEPKSLHLSFDEAEAVAADLARVWPGITGLAETPKTEQIADLVQRTLRKTRDLIDARDAVNS